ncbi:hypothetical protein C351_04422 [Cryptococcus neoformans c8]|nr:hypothetical protein C353_04540 [Cryptococcus neoformans var. grubii AD1-83a]OXG55244.1 hypothetical protein C354_04474 [Cryptococcus neoformans var. grubii MW-RSA1955]OXG60891.1 hypothetical protein C351_04422 [Cryptococcus neoformans var. grubii c8]OXH07063.1 hypothetical protein C369_04516 [Cryptococcus neoformans var. grubii A5-35-17]OXH08637.1 hypothetical protein C370_04591 [Cryptococcus neoformans var. grubii A1-35-8]
MLPAFVQGEIPPDLYRTIPPNTPRMKQGPVSPFLVARAIKIAKVPTLLHEVVSSFFGFGFVEDSRILPGKRHGFINFERLDSAVAAYEAFNGKEIFSAHHGPIQIDFARVPTRAPSDMPFGIVADMGLKDSLNFVDGASTVPIEQQLSEGSNGVENYRSLLLVDLLKWGCMKRF